MSSYYILMCDIFKEITPSSVSYSALYLHLSCYAYKIFIIPSLGLTASIKIFNTETWACHIF